MSLFECRDSDNGEILQRMSFIYKNYDQNMYLIGGKGRERLRVLCSSLLMKYSLSLSSSCRLLMGAVGTAEEKHHYFNF